jgi:sugar transferase (PEP-CTERM/EpsH1 system associated)
VRILYLCHRFPYPPQRGGKIRPFNMIRHFTEQGHRVVLASVARSEAEAQAGAGIQAHTEKYLVETIGSAAASARMVMRLPSLTPSSFGYFYSPALRKRVTAELGAGSFDLIFVHCSSAAQYVHDVRGVPKILDFGDMDSQKWHEYAVHRKFPLSLGYGLEGVKVQRAEARMAARFDMCTCTTRAELETLRSYGVPTHSDWFPNGVDSEFFSPVPEPHDPDLVAFVGRMDYFPNQQAVIEFCRDVLPSVQARRPGTRFQIIGAEPPEHIRDLGKLPGVSVTGSVPDVRPLVRRAALTVAPLRIARGTQNKILESMSMGVPVVSSLEASGGVDAVAGEHLLVASNPQEMTESVLRLVGDSQERPRLAAAGRARVLSNHSWSASMRRLDEIVSRTVTEFGSPAMARA